MARRKPSHSQNDGQLAHSSPLVPDPHSTVGASESDPSKDSQTASGSDSISIDWHEFDESIETAFQLTTLKGPLCAEPLMGMSFAVEGFEVDMSKSSVETGPFTLCFTGHHPLQNWIGML